VKRSRRKGTSRLCRSLATALPLALVVLLASGSADAGTPIKRGKYSGRTDQSAVGSSFRQVQFTVSKKGKVTLTTEPTVAREACLSTPVFTLDGTPTKKLSGNRSFTFTHTFMGNKFDKIHGRFTSSNEVEGYALYHFQAQDLCSAGKMKVTFTAQHK
jgi:hypothetical protein